MAGLVFSYIIIPGREFPSMRFLLDILAFESFRKDGNFAP
jgi:hypothetical protein